MSTSSESTPPAVTAMIHPISLLKRFWLLLVIAVLIVGYGVHWFSNAFLDQGYAPTQPIAYSHKLHAGELKIDCQYCHFNVSRGKFAGVPPMSVCIGCHKQVATDKPEIQKLLAIEEKGSYVDTDGVEKTGGVVHWNRVHRLPDHVYFSHEWHVKGGVACQTCHGPVEEMVKVRQQSPLTMEWCLDCHRKMNYVGGREYQPGKAETFTVGAGNYVAANQQEERDPVVDWHERQLKGHDEVKPATPASHGVYPEKVSDVEPFSERMANLIAKHPEWKDLPSWRIADLPESHRVIYGKPELMNAATQCSTCHQ